MGREDISLSSEDISYLLEAAALQVACLVAGFNIARSTCINHEFVVVRHRFVFSYSICNRLGFCFSLLASQSSALPVIGFENPFLHFFMFSLACFLSITADHRRVCRSGRLQHWPEAR